MNKFLPFLILILSYTLSWSQQTEPCGHTDYIDALEKQFPGFKQAQNAWYENALDALRADKLKKRAVDSIMRIPVVIHIVYNTPAENLHDSFAISQVKVLNECYRKQNADTVNTRDIFKPVAADARIEFYLATKDPNGNPTNGITDTYSAKTTFYSLTYADDMKFTSAGGIDAWDPSTYLNIWVCDLSFNGQDALLGYAFPPTNAQFWTSQSYVPVARQGVVLHYKILGLNNPLYNNAFSTGEKTAVHEVGHYLGLRHVWGDGNSTNGCNVDDGIFDTPNTRVRHSGCNKGINTCGAGTTGDMPDQAENYMDYGSRICTSMFTAEQVNLMRYNLFNLRPSIGDKVYVMGEPEILLNNMYPNPASDLLTIEITGVNRTEVYKLEIKDMLGQTAFLEKRFLTGRNTFDISGLASSMYYVELYNAAGQRFFKRKLTVVRN